MDFDFDINPEFGDDSLRCAEVRLDQSDSPPSPDWVFSKIHDAPTRNTSCSNVHNSFKSHKKKLEISHNNDGSDSESGMEKNEDEWTASHPAVGMKVLQYFEINGEYQAFIGEVVSFLPASSQHSGDQLYHIEYEDDDTEDFDQIEYTAGRKAFESIYAR
jgi:hypothetical protein